jgi:hypothetical protein
MNHSFRDPISNAIVHGEVNDIVAKVMRIRQHKGLPSDRGIIYNEVIRTIQTKNIRVAKNKQRKIPFRDAMAAGKAALKIIKGDVVSKQEMDRRWAICKGCPAITETKECFSCNRAKFLADITNTTKSIFGSDIKYPGESKKLSCGVCGCMLAMLLPTKSDDLHKDTPLQKEIRPDFCWMNPESPNFVAS